VRQAIEARRRQLLVAGEDGDPLGKRQIQCGADIVEQVDDVEPIKDVIGASRGMMSMRFDGDVPALG
jgi:hypothetical protein